MNQTLFSVIKGKEKSVFHSYKYDQYDLPLKVMFAGASEWTAGDNFNRYNSDVFSINLVTAGNGVFTQNGKPFLVEKGELFFPRKNCTHSFKTGTAGFLHKRFVSIDGPLLYPLLSAIGLAECDYAKPASGQTIRLLMKRIYGLLKEKPAEFTSELSCSAYQLLLEIGKSVASGYAPEMQSIAEYIKRNIHLQLGVPEISRHMGCSVRHCHAACRPVPLLCSQPASKARR